MVKFAFTACMAVLFSFAASARDYSANTHFYGVEYLKPIAGENLSILNVTFNRKLDTHTADRVLREELQRVLELFPPNGNVMAYAWTQTDPAPGSEEEIALADGSHFLIYLPDTRQTQTEKQYDLSKQKPAEAGKAINVDFALESERGSDGGVRILGRTNLPHGMTLMLQLRGTASKYFARDSMEVINGQVVSAWFSDGGKPLPPGLYEVEISSGLPDLQPSAVRSVIGQTGENLAGPIRTFMGSKMVDYAATKSVK